MPQFPWETAGGGPQWQLPRGGVGVAWSSSQHHRGRASAPSALEGRGLRCPGLRGLPQFPRLGNDPFECLWAGAGAQQELGSGLPADLHLHQAPGSSRGRGGVGSAGESPGPRAPLGNQGGKGVRCPGPGTDASPGPHEPAPGFIFTVPSPCKTGPDRCQLARGLLGALLSGWVGAREARSPEPVRDPQASESLRTVTRGRRQAGVQGASQGSGTRMHARTHPTLPPCSHLESGHIAAPPPMEQGLGARVCEPIAGCLPWRVQPGVEGLALAVTRVSGRSELPVASPLPWL